MYKSKSVKTLKPNRKKKSNLHNHRSSKTLSKRRKLLISKFLRKRTRTRTRTNVRKIKKRSARKRSRNY